MKIAQQSIVKFGSDPLALENILYSLEKLRGYFLNILLLDFMDVSVITLNRVESGIYINALQKRLSVLKVKLSGGKLEKKAAGKLKDEVELIKIMLMDVKAKV